MTDGHKSIYAFLFLATLIFSSSSLVLAEGKFIRATALEANRGMIWIPAGDFHMGCRDPSFNDARPIHKVHISGFWLDQTEVTNHQFKQFADAPGYITVAERVPEADCTTALLAGGIN